MIEIQNKIYKVSLHLYGDPILTSIQAKQENGNIENIAIPFNFNYNGSWRISFPCSACNDKVEFGDLCNEGFVKKENYTLLKYLCSKYYHHDFLEIIPRVFNDTEMISFEQERYVITKGIFDKDFPVTSSLEPLYCQCKNCKTEYLVRLRQGFPMEPAPDNPNGLLGTIFLDEIVGIKVRNQGNLLNLINANRNR